MTNHRFDDIIVTQLRTRGTAKWASYPEHLGAFVAEMDFGVAEPIAEVLQTLVERQSFGYPTAKHRTALRSATAHYYSENYGFNVGTDQVFLATDVLSTLALTIELHTVPTDKLIVLTPAYMPFLNLPQTSGREIIEVPLQRSENRWTVDFALLEQAFVSGGKLLVLSNPHNPVGHSFLPDEFNRISELVERHAGLVFSDEIHAPLTYNPYQHVPYASSNEVAANHTITAFSASKAWNIPGLKCAQVIITNDQWAQQWSNRGVWLADGASTLGIHASLAAYEQAADWPGKVLDYLQGNIQLIEDFLAERLPQASCIPPEATYLAWIDLSSYGNPEETWAGYLQQHAGVVVTAGESCGQAGGAAVRLNFATPRALLQEILDKIETAVQQYSA